MWTAYVFLLSLGSLTEAKFTHLPRMVFTHKVAAAKEFPLPGDHTPVQIILGQADDVITVGQKDLYFYNFKNPGKVTVEKKVPLEHCSNTENKGCRNSIAVVHQRDQDRHVFVCGRNSGKTECCDVNLSVDSPECVVSTKLDDIKRSIGEFDIKRGEHSVLVESEQGSHLYLTYSGLQESVGIHKFGRNRVRPSNPEKEQYYVGLMLNKRRNDSSQDRVYAFYKEKNRDTGYYGDMWIPFVSQVCTSDVGGPKNNLQFIWTSQMKAKLFCGDTERRQHFSELVDVATVHADRWQDTRVYALFRNEWGMSAVCMYTIGDIDQIFTSSPFEGSTPENPVHRPRTCAPDSTKLTTDYLRNIGKSSEMKQWVQPVNKFHPLLVNNHNYTHIYVDSYLEKEESFHTVIYLTLSNGGIHKVLEGENNYFVIAEYRPFNHKAHILGIILHASSKKLYVSTTSELVQLDVANCAQYGNKCEECVLSRDPYCGWNNGQCSTETRNAYQDVARGNPSICRESFRLQRLRSEETVLSIKVPPQSMYILWCPVTSLHARYSWKNPLGSSVNCSYMEPSCLLQIHSMSSEQVGNYRCMSEESSYIKSMVEYNLQLGSSAAVRTLWSGLVWVWVVAVLSFYC